MLSFIRILTASAVVLAASTAIAHDYRVGDLEIGHPWTRVTPPAARVGGGYLTLTNEGDSADRLLGGSSPAAGRVEIHTMEMTDGVMKMRPLPDGVEIPAGETVDFAPGGYHLMLMELVAPIEEGDAIPATLEFERAGTVEIELFAGPLGSPHSDHDASGHSTHEGHD